MSESEHSTAQGEGGSERSKAVLAVELLLVAVSGGLVALQVSPALSTGASPLVSAALDVALGALPVGAWAASRFIPPRGRRLTYPFATGAAAAVVLLGGLTLTAVLAELRRDAIERDARARFDQSVEAVLDSLSRRIELPAKRLGEVRDAFGVPRDTVDPSALRRQAEGLVAARELRGLHGVGFVERVRSDEIHPFDPAPEDDESALRPTTEATFVVRQVEPLTLNWPERGADLGADPPLRLALDRAIDTGEPTLGRKTLTPHHENRGLYRLFVPVYRNGAPRATPLERRRALVGVVYAPLALEEVLDGVARNDTPYLSYALFDVASGGGRPIFTIDRSGAPSSADWDRPISVEVPIFLAGRALTLRASSTPELQSSMDRDAPAWIWALGTLLSGLAALAVVRLAPSVALAPAAKAPSVMHSEEWDSMPPSDVVSGLEERITWVSGRFSSRAPTRPSDRVTMPAPRS